MRDLITATATSCIIGSTCREARDAVAFLLPDKLQMKAYQKLGLRSMAQRPHLSTGYFRFNTKRDIIIMCNFCPTEMRCVLEFSSIGVTLEAFQTIQHLVLDTPFLEDLLLPMIRAYCHCSKLSCQYCSKDQLPHFLRLFPRLKSFHLAQTTVPILTETSTEESVEPGDPCNCVETGQCAKHNWPVFKGMADGVWYISHTEESDCPFPTLPELAYERRLNDSNWPYDAQSDADIRILRRIRLPDT